MNYYVYYKLAAEQVGATLPKVRELLARIESASGVRGRLLRRRDDPSTYMEVYEDVADDSGFEALLEREAAPLGLQRHVERFVAA